MKKILIILGLIFTLFGTSCSLPETNKEKRHISLQEKNDLELATFAGGCFWCIESDFEKVPGVKDVISGYTGGTLKNPSYEKVSSGKSGHKEAIEIYYDPNNITYEELLDVFWRHHDPTDPNGSFVDKGMQYTSAIYYHTSEQKKIAIKSLKKINTLGIFEKTIITEILPAGIFYVAENYHQDYHKKNPIKYNYYRKNSGRDTFIKKTWNK